MIIPFERLERILLQVRRPGRYVGGEVNAVHKDWATTPTRICLAFPDIYDLGMSNLGILVLYDVLNRLDGVLAERTYLPWPDMAAALREEALPLYSLESFHALTDFDVIGFSLSSEGLYTNLLEMLDLAGIPLLSRERDERHPLIVAGGHATFNPEPMADFVDVFLIGDGEEGIVDVVRTYERTRDEDREAQLTGMAQIPGTYIPRFYEVAYRPNGQIGSISPTLPQAPYPVLRRVVPVLPPTPTRQLVPNVSVTHDRGVIEIQRGCSRGCRFCHAGIITRPVRERPLEEILQTVDRMLEQTGYEEIGLLSLSSSDYSRIGELVEALMERYADLPLSISLPSLRIESFSVDLAESISRGRRTGFTFAPEAGTERLRNRINKPIPGGEMLEVAREVFRRGFQTVKLYFMIGLPGEEPEDVEAIIQLVHAVRREGKKVHGRRTQVNVSVNTFIPKPHTPFQWSPLADPNEVRIRQEMLQRRLQGGGLKLSWSNPHMALIEAILSRGDRRLGEVIRRAWEEGARLDGWDEWFDYAAWAVAFAQTGIDPDFYVYRTRSKEEVFPWDLIDTGVRKAYLWREWELSQQARSRPDCREQCYGCGILTRFGNLWAPTWSCPPPKGGERE